MKTSFDLPDALVRELQRRAQQSGQEMSQAVADLLSKGLAASPPVTESPQRAKLKTHAITGLPFIECPHTASPTAQITPERVAELLLEQEVTWQHEAGR